MNAAGVTKKVTVIGGGSGSYQLLTGLKARPGLEIRSIVSMMDSGGDSGDHRDDFGVLPPGDLRRCLVALSEETELVRELFQYRFDEAWLSGRSLGNLLMLALTRMRGSEKAAVAAVSQLLKVRGEVVPVTWDDAHLHARLADGTTLAGETAIDQRRDGTPGIDSVYLHPAAAANPRALEVIADADYVILAPGDLYTSVIANLVVGGVREALRATPARLVYVQNLMTKPGETKGYTAARHVAEVARYAGRVPDVVLAHRGGIPEHLRERYRAECACEVVIDSDALYALGVAEVMRADLMSGQSYVRHDPDRLAAALLELFAAHDDRHRVVGGVGS